MSDDELDEVAAAEMARLNNRLQMSALDRRKKELEMRHKNKTPKKWEVKTGQGAAPSPSASQPAQTNYEPTWKRLEREERERAAAGGGGGQTQQQQASGASGGGGEYIPTWKRLEMEQEASGSWEPPAVRLKKQQEAQEAAKYRAEPSYSTGASPARQNYQEKMTPQLRDQTSAPPPRRDNNPPAARGGGGGGGGGDSGVRTCAQCRKEIAPGSTIVKADGKEMHQSCFCCHSCGTPITSKYNMFEGKVTCDSCIDKLDSKICHRCDKNITRGEEFTRLEARGVQYHVNCFSCRTCGVKLGGQYYWEEPGEVYCEKHPE